MALFRLLFQRYASALLLSTAPRKFIKATKNDFFLYKNRPGFLLRKPGWFVCFICAFSSAHAITCGGAWSQPGRVPKLQGVRSSDKSSFFIINLSVSSLKNLSILYAILHYSLCILWVSLTFKLHCNFLNVSFFYKLKCNWI